MELAAASPVRTAAANFGRKVHSTLEGLKVLQRPLKQQQEHLYEEACLVWYIRVLSALQRKVMVLALTAAYKTAIPGSLPSLCNR